jgi:hypothetical protein
MTKVVNPRQLSFWGDDVALLKQGLENTSQSGPAVSSSTPSGVPYESRIRANGKPPPSFGTQTFFYLIGNRPVDGKEA